MSLLFLTLTFIEKKTLAMKWNEHRKTLHVLSLVNMHQTITTTRTTTNNNENSDIIINVLMQYIKPAIVVPFKHQLTIKLHNRKKIKQ